MGDRTSQGREVSVMSSYYCYLFVPEPVRPGGEEEARGQGGGGARERSRLFQEHHENYGYYYCIYLS